MSTTAEIQAYVRANTATAYSYEGDLHALCDLAGVPAGHLLERLGALLETLPQGVLALLQNGSVEELLPILAPFSPASLFANGEPGVWYDPSDFSTMFQDAAGTVPVTSVEQPVGLILDKSRGLGPELVTNGTFDADTSGWTADAGASAVRDATIFTGGGMLVTAKGGGSSYARQTLTGLTAGRRYVISASVYTPSTNAANSVATIGIQAAGFTATGSRAQSVLNTVQTISISFVAAATTQTIYMSVVTADFISFGAAGSVGYFDNISVRELPGNHAFQNTATSRPVLRQDGSGKHYLYFDGVDDSLVTPTITPGIDKVQVFAGVRKLSDVGDQVVFELSSNQNSFDGNFGLFVAGISNAAAWRFSSKGTVRVFADAAFGSFLAPITNVLASIGDISSDSAILRVNGTQAASSTTDQGTGNYLAYPLFIGRREGTSFPFNGHLYGLVLRFGSNLPIKTIEQAEAWINSKTGAY